MGSLSYNQVYVIQPGRRFDEDDTSLADDVVATGYNMLTFGSSSPLKQFNQSLITLQQRHQVRPLIGPGSEPPELASHLVYDEGECSHILKLFGHWTDI